MQNPSEAQRKEHEKYEFALHEVYAVDVLISSGEGQVENFSINKIFSKFFTLRYSRVNIHFVARAAKKTPRSPSTKRPRTREFRIKLREPFKNVVAEFVR